MLLWDFGQARNRWRSALAASDAAESDAEAARQTIVLDARLAFFDALETRELIQVARETLTNQERRLSQTEEFVRIGTRPAIDLARLRTDVATARSALIRAENDHRIAKSRLNRAMGVKGSIDYEVAAAKMPALEAEGQETAQLYAAAIGHRPEHAAQRASIRGQEADVRAARSWFLPSLRLGADASYSGQDFGDPGFGASVGVTLNWNLFDGLASPAATDAARAQLVVQQARLTRRAPPDWQEIEQARIGVTSAQAEVGVGRAGPGLGPRAAPPVRGALRRRRRQLAGAVGRAAGAGQRVGPAGAGRVRRGLGARAAAPRPGKAGLAMRRWNGAAARGAIVEPDRRAHIGRGRRRARRGGGACAGGGARGVSRAHRAHARRASTGWRCACWATRMRRTTWCRRPT